MTTAPAVPETAEEFAAHARSLPPIASLAFTSGTGYIQTTRADGSEHGMFSSREHAYWLAHLHNVPLTVNGEPVDLQRPLWLPESPWDYEVPA